ncbi:MAG TPA: sulfate adenylyltransferase subunit CysN [Candidatus Competibacteraceae bacterium]|nr:MAG: sulfate adenylyltransferase subunit CysN [Candidatus Competibacteraceae bacterium]HOB63404.1 sulfate adenylyltransferase subunit CysN [Candidatus Competibacteraceae bacterium]HQA27346.1 sulfate adenylyltransferase subunit CysN [Candidatus Competibacteraceae bacterium]HQD57850.1 sulfate adenylyltransferase subunit CysN [Candidatus Competibacteraceae bacterium]
MSHASSLIETDIQAYLAAHERKDLLRFITCGSVDDGKSTLIGRLLYDSQLIHEDQLLAVRRDTSRYGTTGEELDLALLVDGLQAEREQGITIDVAYRYFSTEKRKFIIADTPGHEQYTRNMATGASTAQLAVLLVDARRGVQVQTRRHSFIVSLLGIRHLVLAVNKMDLMDYDQAVFERICEDYREFVTKLGVRDVRPVPVSALRGDNVAHPSDVMPWYTGPTLLQLLEDVEVTADRNLRDFRFPVQYVNRPNLDFRGYCGTLASGVVRPGDDIIVLPSGRRSQVTAIITAGGELEQAVAGQAVTLTLRDEIDISRGDLLAHPDHLPAVADTFDARVVWMADAPLLPGRQYDIKLATRVLLATPTDLYHRIDVNTLEHQRAEELGLNEIGYCRFSLNQPAPFDPYHEVSGTGGFIIIDRISNITVGAGMIVRPVLQPLLDKSRNVIWHQHKVTKQQRANQKAQQPCVIWLTGLSSSGKSTLANALEQRLLQRGYHSYLLDGDNVRHGLNQDLGFSKEDRVENIRRIGEVAALFVDAGLIVITAFISPFRADRAMVRALMPEGEFIEVHVRASLAVCEQRDAKGLYAKARAGVIRDFTGIDSPYEMPERPELVLDTEQGSVEDCLEQLLAYLGERRILRGG